MVNSRKKGAPEFVEDDDQGLDEKCASSYTNLYYNRNAEESQVLSKVECAAEYVKLGYQVLPLHTIKDGKCSCGKDCHSPGKHPRYDSKTLSDGRNSASYDPEQISKWWERWPDANIGVVTGSETDLVVLDLDVKVEGGIDGIENAKEIYAWKPEGPYQRTGGGGLQAFYRRPDSADKVKSCTGAGSLAPGVEVKADGGYVVVPPSDHISGGSYNWEVPLDDKQLPELPQWALKAGRDSAGEAKKPATIPGDVIPSGRRNEVLTSLAGVMRRKGTGKETILAALKAENKTRCSPPLSESEVKSIAESVSRYDAQNDAEKDRTNASSQVRGMVDNVKASRKIEEVFKSTHMLAQLSRSENAIVRGELKDILGQKLNLNELDGAVREAKSEMAQMEKDARINAAENDENKIEIGGIMVPEAALKVVENLAEVTPPTVFKLGRSLVRLVEDSENRPEFETLSKRKLRSHLGHHFDLCFDGEPVMYPPEDIVDDILSMSCWELPSVRGITQVPVIREDGTILTEEGYDPETRVVYSPDESIAGIKVPGLPSSDDVRGAVRIIEETLHDFPFCDKPSKVNTIALFLTSVARPLIKGLIPVFGINATKEGTGKTKLAHIASLIATGVKAPAFTAPEAEDEWRKTLTSFLMKGSPLVLIDNADGSLQSDALAAAITSETYGGRILGKSEITIPNSKTQWIATGNGLQFAGNLARRGVMVEMDAKTSKPWQRTGFRHPNLEEWVCRHRSDIVGALLTLTRAWVAAGSPKPSDLPGFGGFQEWAETIGGILKHAGINGFLQNLAEKIEQQSFGDSQWEAFLQQIVLLKGFGSPFRASELASEIRSSNTLLCHLPDELAEAYNPQNPSKLNRLLGNAFRRHAGERFGDAGIRVVRGGKERKVARWKIERDKKQQREPKDEFPDLKMQDNALDHAPAQ